MTIEPGARIVNRAVCFWIGVPFPVILRLSDNTVEINEPMAEAPLSLPKFSSRRVR